MTKSSSVQSKTNDSANKNEEEQQKQLYVIPTTVPATATTDTLLQQQSISSTTEKSISSSTVSSSSNNNNKLSSWKDAVAGACSGAVSRTVMAPVERIKLLKQLSRNTIIHTNATTSINSNVHNSNVSAWKLAWDVYKLEGILSFWKGNVPNVLRVSGGAALNFTCMGYYKQITSSLYNIQVNDNNIRTKKFISSIISGGLTGATATTILYPLEFARTRLAVDTYSTPSTSSSGISSSGETIRTTATTGRTRNVLLSIYQQDGIRGLYQGYGVAVAGGIFYRILHLGGYDILKNEILHYKTINQQEQQQQKHLQQHQQLQSQVNDPVHVTWIERLCIAQFISLFAGTLSYPLDSVRRRLMMQAGRTVQERQYTTAYNCVVTIYKQEGIRGFYLGIGPNLLRSIGGALLLFGYDTVRGWL